MATVQDLGKVAYFNKGAYNSETTYEINDVVSYDGSSYVSLGNDNLGNLPTNTAFWSVVASKGDKGDTGKAFVIEKTYATIEDMVADYDNMNINDYVMIQGSVEAQENATLWTKTETEVSPYKWVYLADFSGASGITGATPNIQIGTVTEGNEPSVTRRAGSTNENPILDFVLKTGAKGDTGATGNGISGIEKTSTSGLTDTYTISYTSGNSSTFDVHNGKGISSIAKTSSVGLVDTYTITYNDGTTSTFEITNGEDGEVTQEQLDETNEEVERVNMVYNALPKVSDEDTEFSLDGTAECPVYDSKISPSALKQVSTTGKNLLPNNVSSQIINGITVKVNNDKSIRLSGTATKNIYLYLAAEGSTYPISLTAGTYTLNSNSNTNNVWIRLVDSNSNIYDSVQSATTITLENTTTFNSYIRINNGATINVTLYPQLESGSTATDYEEFTGGQPSPSPSYPQDIHVVSGDNSVKISNKNLFDKNATLTTGYYLSNVGAENPSNNYFITDYVPIKPNTSYATSGLTISGTNPSRCYYDKNKNFISGVKHNDALTIVNTSPANAYFMRESINNADINNIQIEEGSTASSFEPHRTQTYPISLGDLEYCKIGSYEDLFFKNVVGSIYYDSTLVENKWYLKKNITNKTLTTTDFNNIFTTYTNLDYITINKPNDSLNKGNSNDIPVKFTKGTYAVIADFNSLSNISKITSSGGFNVFYFGVNKGITTEQAQNIVSGSQLYYPLATPTYTLLNNTLQTQLDNLSNAISYSQQTNVSQTNNDLPFVIKLSAIRDLSGIFDLIQE